MARSRWFVPTLVALLLAGCEGSSPTSGSGLCARPFFAVALDPAGKALLYTRMHEYNPSIALGAMRRVPLGGTPVSVAARPDGRRAVVPLGDAGYAALVNLETGAVEHELRFPDGSADAAAWVEDDVVLVANRAGGYVARFQLTPGGAPRASGTVTVAPQPVQLLLDGDDVLVLSVNSPVPGQGGRITALNPRTLGVRWVTPTWGTNPEQMAVEQGTIYVLNRNGYPLQPGGGVSTSRIIVLDRATQEPVRGYQAGQGATSLNVFNLLGYVTGPTQGTTIRYLMDQVDIGPLQFFCARDASGACRNVGSAWGYDYEQVFQTVVDRPWIYRFDIDRRPDGPVHVLADSVPLPAGSTGVSLLQSFDLRTTCNDVIITEG
jgi:hypothetical protein